jgi:coenzyme F420 hydrogenase subunit beta
MNDKLAKGPEQLKSEVIEPGWCVSCGACSELCPYIKAVQDRVAVTHICGLTDGNCYKVCPRTYMDYGYLQKMVAGQNGGDPALGSYRQAYIARSTDRHQADKGQYGGAVTALISHALAAGLVEEALLTTAGDLYPRVIKATTKEEVLSAAGSKYGVIPGLSGLNEALRQNKNNLAVVGRPCQVTALRKMQYCSTVNGRDGVSLILGLFCFWGLDYSFYREMENRGVNRIYRADIPRDAGLFLETDRGEVILSLEETRSFVRTGCHSCFDPTSELADISVGSTESDPGWSVVLVRTGRGEELVKSACSAGVLETRQYPEEMASRLREAALNKKRRVINPPADGPAVNNSYIELAEDVFRWLKGGE